MKKITILLLALLIPYGLNADISIDKIKQMVEQIHKKRKGVSLTRLDQTQEPFVELVVTDDGREAVIRRATERIPEVKMKLHAIMNGKAFINKKWVKKGEQVSAFTLVHIGKRGVVLKNNTTIKKLFLHTKLKYGNFKIITKD